MTGQPELEFDRRPRQLISDTAAEFQGLCDRATRGEFAIESVERGDGNAQWIFRVRWPVNNSETSFRCDETG